MSKPATTPAGDRRAGTLSSRRYVALPNDLVLKRDGDRALLYALDFIESRMFFLTPLQGLALSMLDGTWEFREVEADFRRLFPDGEVGLGDVLTEIDVLVRQNATASGVGRDGVLQQSDRPIEHAFRYDPREFVVPVRKHEEWMRDIRKRRRLETPINIMAFFTHRCETNCIYCYAQRTRVPEMPLGAWRDIIRQMRDLDIRMMSLDNGDTLARRDGVEFLEELCRADVHFMLSTKAHLSERDVKRLVAAGFAEPVRHVARRVVQLSVDAWDEDKATFITGNPAFKRQMADTFDHFMREGIVPKIKAVVMPVNADQPLKLVEYFYPRGARRFQFVRYMRSFFRHTDDLFLDEQSAAVAMAQVREIRERYSDIDLTSDFDQIDPYRAPLTPEQIQELWANRSGCSGGWTMLGVAPDGKAILCEQMALEEPFHVGDLAEQSIMDVWNCERLLDFIYPPRERFAGTVCYDCEEFELCHWEKGYCYRNAYFSYGTLYEAPPLCPKQTKPGLRLT
jgi:radical SAM protein with 4Fe4S-binding SPASM domain